MRHNPSQRRSDETSSTRTIGPNVTWISKIKMQAPSDRHRGLRGFSHLLEEIRVHSSARTAKTNGAGTPAAVTLNGVKPGLKIALTGPR